MKRAAKKLCGFALALILFVGLGLAAPIQARALATTPIPAGGTITAPGLYDISTTTETTITITAGGVALTGTKINLKVVISATVTLTLKDAHITGPSNDVAIYAGGANCGLILVGTNSATATGNGGAGVAVPNASSITIEGPGQLTATGGRGAAGIGGSTGASSGSITIRHAVIIANGASSGAGIGGGSGNAGTAGGGSNITITNSSVVAKGGDAAAAPTGGGAGIGGGGGGVLSVGGVGSIITITNSVVQAEGGNGYTTPQYKGTAGGAGIGGGGGGSSGSGVNYAGGAGTNITIDTSSNVQANGGTGANGTTNGGGAGGAAVGGGGGGANAVGGIANTISIGNNTLASGSTPGTGGTGTTTASGGALCGAGGDGNSNTPGAELGTVTPTGPAIDLTSRPQSSYAGYPAFPSTTNPTGQTVTEGDNASFSVTASGGTGAPYYYQWQVSADNGTNWADIAPATNTSAATNALTLSSVAASDNGKLYRVIAYDSVFREVTSAGASLSVNTPPTITGNTALTLLLGYANTSTAAYSITGNPAPTVSKTSGDAAITWDNVNKKLDIAAGLGVGTYPVVLTAGNGVSPSATLTFTLTVNAVDHSPINPPDPNTPFDLSKDAVVTFNGDYTNLARVLLNGQEMPQSVVSAVESTLGWGSYSGSAGDVKAGSVVVTLYKEFLQCLPNGVYSLEVEFLDGGVTSSGAADFLIQRVEPSTSTPAQDPTPTGGSPQTGDGSNLPLWALCGAAALAGLCGCGAVVFRRRRPHNRAG